MKTNKYFNLFLIFIISWALYSCGEDYSSPLSSLSVDDVILKYDQKTATIKIGNDNLERFETFSISSSTSWCKVQFDEIWKNNVNIKVEDNTTYDERRAVITIKDPEDGTTLLVNIIQEPEYVYLSDKDTYEIPEEGGQVSINIKSNVDYSVVIPDDANWLTYSKTRGLSQSTITFSASKNDSGEERIATVNLNGPTAESSSHITIKQLITPYIYPEPSVFNADEDGGDIEILISTNVDVETYINSDWIQDAGRITKDGRNFIQKIRILPLGQNKKRRTGRISFYSKNEALNGYAVVSITQGIDFSIKNGDFEINVGDSYSLSLDTQYEGEIIWTSSNTSVATVNNKGKVTGIGKGTAIIKAASADGRYYDQVTVTVISNIIDNIEDFISGYTDFGYKMEMSSAGSFVGYFVSCYIENSSTQDVVVNKCTIYENGSYLDEIKDYGTLKAGGTKKAEVRNKVLDITTRSYKFVWEYSYNGKAYTYTVNYK